MRIGILTLLALAACSPQSQPANDTLSNDTTSPAPPVPEASPAPAPVASPFAPPTTTLPKPLLGTWTADPAGRCVAGTELRIVVTPDAIRFHESVARIVSVTQTDPHNWRIVTEATGEGETRERRFSLYLGELGGMTRVEPPAPDLTYQRCKA